jgi:flagellar biosynthesis/type III secretory pathway protein FliH
MDAVIARYLPEIASGPVPPQGARDQASGNPGFGNPSFDNRSFDNPWAGLARAPRAALPLPETPDAIRIEPARAEVPPAGPLDAAPAEWLEGLLPRAATPPAPAPPVAEAASPLVKPAATKRETPEERAALLAAAEERGRQQGLAQAREEAEIARQHAAHAAEARLAEARRHWSEAEAEALADGFAAALRALDATLSDRIARLLVPVLTDALRRQAVAELSGALARLLAEPQAAHVRVSGPEDLLAALAARLGPLAASVSFTASETAEVQVSADQTVIDTQLGAWTRLIAAAVAET